MCIVTPTKYIAVVAAPFLACDMRDVPPVGCRVRGATKRTGGAALLYTKHNSEIGR